MPSEVSIRARRGHDRTRPRARSRAGALAPLTLLVLLAAGAGAPPPAPAEAGVRRFLADPDRAGLDREVASQVGRLSGPDEWRAFARSLPDEGRVAARLRYARRKTGRTPSAGAARGPLPPGPEDPLDLLEGLLPAPADLAAAVEARKALEAGKAAEARRQALALLARKDAPPALRGFARRLAAEAAFAEGKDAEAAELLAAHLRDDASAAADPAGARYLRGLALERAGRAEDARAAFEEYLRLHPEDAEGRRRIAREKAGGKASGSARPEPARDQPSLDLAARKMGEVESILAEGSSDQKTQARVAEVIKILEDLLQDPPPSPPSGGGGDSPKPPPSGGGGSSSPPPPPPSGGGGEKTEPRPSGGGEPKPAPREREGGAMDESRIPPPRDPADPNLHKEPPRAKDPWGFLPPKDRKEILEIQKTPFPPEYRRLLEEYYKRLSEGE